MCVLHILDFNMHLWMRYDKSVKRHGVCVKMYPFLHKLLGCECAIKRLVKCLQHIAAIIARDM